MNKILRVHKTNFHASRKNFNRLFACNRESAKIWNVCLEHAKAYHQETGKWIGKTALQKATKGQFPLHSQSIQAVCHNYLWARNAAHQARKKGCDNRYPWRQKKNFPTRWAKDGFTIYPNGKIELSMGIWKGKRQAPIVVFVKDLPAGKIKEIELIWDRRLMLGLTYEDGLDTPELVQGQLSAIDIGEIHAIASVTETGEALVITARKLRSIKRLRNKKYKELYKKRSRCKKGSRRYKKLSRAIRKISSKTDNQQRDILHKASRQYVNWAKENQVAKVYVGDVEGVQRNTSAKKKTNPKKKRRSRQHNQRMSQWAFGLLIAYLTYKLSAEGIVLKITDESYTTQTCPVCGRRKKPSGRIYRCKCGYELHRDVHGARNILAKAKYGEIIEGDIQTPTHVTYLRPVA